MGVTSSNYKGLRIKQIRRSVSAKDLPPNLSQTEAFIPTLDGKAIKIETLIPVFGGGSTI